jgi:16S rRNA G966 N2-methylase RsmD
MSFDRALNTPLKALPTYAGSKKNLVTWIARNLNEFVPLTDCHEMIFLDAFSGGGSVSLMAKYLGFKQVLTNDWSKRSNIVGKAILENDEHILTHPDLLFAFQTLVEERLPGFIESNYCPSVFASRHAHVLDQLFQASSQVNSPIKRELYRLLLWHIIAEFVAFPTSIGKSNRPFAECMDAQRDWMSLNPKRFQDGSIQKLLQPIWPVLLAKTKLIKGGIFKGAPVTMSQQDARAFIADNSGDILYLDPPYAGTLSYEKTNRVLDSLLTGQIIPESPPSSPYTQSTEMLHALLESARHIPCWVLSYGNHQLTLDELVALVKQHAPDREVQGVSKRYVHMPHVSKSTNNQELLIVAAPKKEVISYDSGY